MRIRPPVTESTQILSGWKDIASYLGKGVRTVQRYERELALPVRRPAGKPAGSVVATKTELDAWICASPIRETFDLTTPPAITQSANAAARIKEGIAEMKRLRDEMLALRGEVKSSLLTLRKNIVTLTGEIKPNNYATYAAVKSEPRPRRNVFGLLDPEELIISDAEAWPRKALPSSKLARSAAVTAGTNR